MENGGSMHLYFYSRLGGGAFSNLGVGENVYAFMVDPYGNVVMKREVAECGSMCEKWYMFDKLHRYNGPAMIWYNKDGNLTYMEWFKRGRTHRLGGPAVVIYDNNGNLKREVWYNEGMRHKEDGPASVKYHNNGRVKRRDWYTGGDLHNESGPAKIWYNKEDGSVIKSEWWLYGVNCSYENYSMWMQIPSYT